MKKSHQPYIYALVAIFFWSTIPTAFKICLGELGILPMLTIASLTSAAALLLIMFAGGKINLIMQTTDNSQVGRQNCNNKFR